MPNARPQCRCQAPVAAQRCAEGAGLDSGAVVAAQSAMPSIAILWSAPTADDFQPTPTVPVAPQLEPRISTSLTDVTHWQTENSTLIAALPCSSNRGRVDNRICPKCSMAG